MLNCKRRILAAITAVAMMITMCFSEVYPTVVHAKEVNEPIAKVAPVVIITGTDYIGGEYSEETIDKERILTLNELKNIAAEDVSASQNNIYWHSALNTWNNPSIYKSEGVRIDALFEATGVKNTEESFFNIIAQDKFETKFDPNEKGLGQKESTYTSQSLTKDRYFYPNIGILKTLLTSDSTAADLSKEDVSGVEAKAIKVPTVIAWAKTESKGETDVEKIDAMRLDRWDEDEGKERVQLIVGALDGRDYNNPVWNGDTGCLTIVAGESSGDICLTINGKNYNRTEFVSQDGEIRAYTYQTQNGEKTKISKGIPVSTFLKPFGDEDIITFNCADNGERVSFTKKEIVDGNFMIAYEAGDNVDSLEPIFEQDGDIKGLFTLYGDNTRPLNFISKVTVTAKPEAPKNFTAWRDAGNVKLTWDSVYGADGYNVYRSDSEDGSYTLIETIEGTDSVTFTDSDASTGRCYYKVTAFDSLGSTILESDMTGAVSIEAEPEVTVIEPGIPANFKAARQSYNSIKLTWSKAEHAAGYEIYRYNASKKAYTLHKTINNVETVSYVNSGLATGTKYSYKIRAYAGTADNKVVSNFSSVKAATPTLTKPTVKLTAGKKKITVKWNKITGATGYKVYRATTKNGKYTCVKTVKSGKTVSFTNKALKKGKRYYYKVRAYRTVSGKIKYSSYSAVKYMKAK